VRYHTRTALLVAALFSPALLAGQASVRIEPARASVVAGDSIRFRLVVTDAEGRTIPADSAFWAAGPFEVASTSRGLVRTFRRGRVRVIARAAGRTAFAELEVLPKPAAAIELTADQLTVVVGGRTVVRAMVRDRDREPIGDAAVRFRSLDPTLGRVSEAGAVEAIGPGRLRIEATSGPARSVVEVAVVVNPVVEVAVRGPAAGRTGDVLRFSALLAGPGGREIPGLNPVWSVTGEGGTVYPDGAFVATRPGAYLVTATVGQRSATREVSIAPRVHDRRVEQVTSLIFPHLQIAEIWPIGNALYASTVLDRLYVFDLADPARPRLTDSVIVDARMINDVTTTADGTIGILTREGASSRKNGIVFLDLADPLHPKVLSEYTATVTSGVHSVVVVGRLAYLTDNGHRMLRIVDFADPRNPREVGHWQIENTVVTRSDGSRGSPRSPSDATEVNGRYLHDLQIVDGIAYLAYLKDGLVILDVGNGIRGGTPTRPAFVSQFVYSTADYYPPEMIAGTHTMFRFDDYLVVGDEVLPAFADPWSRDYVKTLGRLHLFDVSDLTTPKLVAFYDVPDQGNHNVWVEGRTMYVASFESGLKVVDVSGELRGDLRAQGREIGGVRTAASTGFRPNVAMAFSAIPHKGMIYTSDMNSGVWVARLAPKSVTP